MFDFDQNYGATLLPYESDYEGDEATNLTKIKSENRFWIMYKHSAR